MKITAILFCLFLLAACSTSQIPKPDSLIPADKMAQILTDVHVADAVLYDMKKKKSNLTKESSKYYHSIYKKYGTTRVEIDSSFKYYARNPQTLEKIYEVVVKNLENREQKILNPPLK